MSKASLVLADGTKVTIEGTADEVASVLQRVASRQGEASQPNRPQGRRPGGTSAAASARSRNTGPADYIRGLIAEDFFVSRRGLGDIQKKLEEGAHIYPVTTLSPILFRLVRAKELRRFREGGTWKYVNP